MNVRAVHRHRVVRLAAAALLAAAVTGAAGAVAGERADPTVTLQVVPRGPGVVSATPVGTDTATNAAVKAPCSDNQEPGECRWTYAPGTAVTLTASPGTGASFAGWSIPDCPGTTPTCRVVLDTGVISVVALFSPLTLRVLEPQQGRITGPAGIDCPGVRCDGAFAAHAKVTLTYIGPSFQRWEFGCLPADQPTCTVDVAHQPAWVGVKLQNQASPQHPDVVSVHLRVRKTGDGSGTVSGTGTKIDCGSSCDGEFSEEDTVALKATADPGSLRKGWGGVCPDADATCRVAVAAFSQVSVAFAKEGPPTAPGGLALTGSTQSSLTFGWQASSDDVGVAGYDASLDGGTAQQVAATSATFAGLACGSAHTVSVTARDAAGNRSAAATLAATTAACPLAVTVTSITVSRRGARRELIALMRASAPSNGRMTLLRGGRVVASQQLHPRAGSFRVRLVMPRTTPRGSLLLRIVLRDAGGTTFQLERTVTVR